MARRIARGVIMVEAETLWLANNDGQAAVALPPMAAGHPPRRARLGDRLAVVTLSDGSQVRLDTDHEGSDAIRRIACETGRLTVFEVDEAGGVRRVSVLPVTAH